MALLEKGDGTFVMDVPGIETSVGEERDDALGLAIPVACDGGEVSAVRCDVE